MKILMISGDKQALSKESGTHHRLLLQARHVDWLEIFVADSLGRSQSLGGRGIVRGFPGGKLSAARAMIRAARLLSFDIVTAQDPFLLGLVGWRIARRSRAKLQLQLHTDVLSPAYSAASMGNMFRHILAQIILRHADCIRAVSEKIKHSLQKKGIRAPISVLPIFINAAAIAKAPAANLKGGYPRFSKVILVAARLEKEKRIDQIICAMKKIIQAIPDAGLCIAGEGSQRQALESLARSLNIEHGVIFLGNRNDIFSLYKSADVLIAASAPYEGYGASVVEALAAGCPVLSEDVGIAREAGATIASSERFAQAAIKMLQRDARGVLTFPLPSPGEWAAQWKEILLHC